MALDAINAHTILHFSPDTEIAMKFTMYFIIIY